MSQEPSDLVERMEHHQITVYLGAMAAGALAGWAAPSAGPGLEHAINPVLGALLFVPFLQVPAAELLRSLRDGRFLAAALVVNFVVVPLVVVVIEEEHAIKVRLRRHPHVPAVRRHLIIRQELHRHRPHRKAREQPRSPTALKPLQEF